MLKKFPLRDAAQVFEETINGGPGFYVEEHGRPVQTMAFDIQGGRIAAVYNRAKPGQTRPIDPQLTPAWL